MKALFGLLVFLCLASLPLCPAQTTTVTPPALTFVGTSDITQPPHVQTLYIEEIPVDSQLNFNVSFNFNTTICLNYLVPVPFSANWASVCSCYFNLTNLNGTTIISTNSTSSLRRGVVRADAHPTPNYLTVQTVCPNIRSGTYFVSVLPLNVTINTTVVLSPSYTTCEGVGQTGPQCSSEVLPSSDNTPIIVPVTQGQTYIQYTPLDTPQSLTVSVTGDAVILATTAIWVRIGSPAFSSAYNDVPCGLQGNAFVCESLNPPALDYSIGGVWFVTLQFAETEPLTTISVVIQQTSCTPGTFGPNCAVIPTLLQSNLTDVVPFTPPVNGISYYIVPTNTSLNFSVTVDGNAAAPALIVGYNNLPTLDQFLIFVNGSTTNVVNIIPTNNLLGPYVIGVVGTVNVTYSYFVTPCPNGCKDGNHGDCIPLTGICNCRSEYEAIDCSELRDSFKIEYIVLISIGGALVLAIVIGVPIYCYLHRRKEYERV